MLRFKKIKFTKDGKVEMNYEVKGEKGWDFFSFVSSDEPAASFRNAVAALAEDVVDMCELPEEYADRITVRGVSFSYAGENDVMGATITAKMRLNKSSSPLNLNTPYKIEEHYSEHGADEQLLDGDCVNRLATLQEESEKYIKGLRAQLDIFGGAASPGKKKVKAA